MSPGQAPHEAPSGAPGVHLSCGQTAQAPALSIKRAGSMLSCPLESTAVARYQKRDPAIGTSVRRLVTGVPVSSRWHESIAGVASQGAEAASPRYRRYATAPDTDDHCILKSAVHSSPAGSGGWLSARQVTMIEVSRPLLARFVSSTSTGRTG